MNVHSYLARIGYTGFPDTGFETLAALQKAHLLTVPFENLDIHAHIPIDLSRLFEKIVIRNRGGFCYELNSLFYELLKAIGFNVKMISARVYDKEKGFGPEFDHMAIIVALDGVHWLVDVGFGEFAFQPMRIETGREQKDPRGVFRIDEYDSPYKMVVKKNTAGEFVPEYIFSETERKLSEFETMCLYHQTSPESHFTQKRICSLPTDDGRITLTGNILKKTSGETVTEAGLENEDEVRRVLEEIFKIKIDP